jgi:hypothetical protein
MDRSRAGDQAATLSHSDLRRALFDACREGDDRKQALWREYRHRTLLHRVHLDDQAAADEQVRARLMRAILPRERTTAEFTRAFLAFCRQFGHVVEPRDAGEGYTLLAFIPYPNQEWLAWELCDAYLAGATVFVEKSRDMGATWLALHFVIWLWLIEPGLTWHLGSRTEDLVDLNPGGANDDTLLGRCEIITNHLPDWLKPEGYDLDDKSQRQKKLWTNPANGNKLTGEAAAANFSRQTRKTGVLVDELAFWEHQREVIRGTKDTCRVRIFLTSANPDADAVKDFMRRPGVRVIRQGWQLHPEKTLAWYEAELADRGDEETAHELDMSWEGGAERRIYSEWDAVPQGEYGFKPGHTLIIGLDFGRSDDTAIVVCQRDPATKRVRFLACHLRAGEQIDFFLPFLGAPILSGIHDYSAQERELIERIQSWIKRAGGFQIFGDPSGEHLTQAANTSVIGVLAAHKVYVKTNPRIKSHDERQNRCKLLLRNAEADRVGCRLLSESMLNYRRPPARRSVGYQKRAIHNRYSHACTAVEYIACNLDDLTTLPLPEPSDAMPRHVAAWEGRAA